ncbi:MAG: YkvI family membrane protein [Tumebacillaceae bacterium]
MTRTEVRLALQIAFTYIGTVVGAGFASGQEILQFFTMLGPYAYAGILLATFMFAWVGIQMLMLGRKLNAGSYREMTAYLFGHKLAGIIDTFMMVMLFFVTVAMLAGVGALFEEQLKMSFQLGVLFTMALTFVTILRGMKGIMLANSIIVPIMLVVVISIFVHAFLQTAHPPHLVAFQNVKPWSWITSGISYAALNLGLAVSVLVPLGGEIKSTKSLKLGGILGAAGLGIMLLGAQYAMSTRMPMILEYEVPMGFLSSTFNPLMQGLFIVALWGEIYSTLIANVYGLGSQLASPRRPMQGSLITVLILTAAFFVAQVGFSNIVQYLYPIFGHLSFLLLLLLLWPRRFSFKK